MAKKHTHNYIYIYIYFTLPVVMVPENPLCFTVVMVPERVRPGNLDGGALNCKPFSASETFFQVAASTFCRGVRSPFVRHGFAVVDLFSGWHV